RVELARPARTGASGRARHAYARRQDRSALFRRRYAAASRHSTDREVPQRSHGDCGPDRGSIWVRGMHAPVAVRGTTSLTHGWTDDSVPDVVQQHIGFVGAAADVAVYLSDVTTPSGDDDRWLVLERGGTVVYQTAAPGVMIDQSASLAAG